MSSFLEQPTRHVFFTGKGAVGKTALACATAIRLADARKRILLVSTDPASAGGKVCLGTRRPGRWRADSHRARHARPDRASLREADRTSGELQALGINNQQLVVNAVLEATDRTDRVALALEERGREAMWDLPTRLRGLPTMRIPLRDEGGD